MLLFHIVILALIQGITEFLPISSSGHLLFAHEIIGNEVLGNESEKAFSENLTIDIAVHIGTLFAVLLYFRDDIFGIIKSVFNAGSSLQGGIEGKRLASYIIIGSLPVIICGYIIYNIAPSWLRSIEVMAWMTLIFGIVLGLVDKFMPDKKEIDALSIKDVLFIGFAQAIAIIPGTSRSGITMSAARLLGFNRIVAARFSLLLAVVAISGAGFLNSIDLISSGNISLGIDVIIAIFMSFISGFIAISLMMKWLLTASFMAFSIYRIIIGLALLYFIYM